MKTINREFLFSNDASIYETLDSDGLPCEKGGKIYMRLNVFYDENETSEIEAIEGYIEMMEKINTEWYKNINGKEYGKTDQKVTTKSYRYLV